MASAQPTVIVIGGSLGGLFAACLLHRSGCTVDVYERTTEPLTGRGAGIVTHVRQLETLARCGVALDASIGCEVQGRIALARSGQVIGRKPLRQVLSAWGRFYDALLSVFPHSRYHRGKSLVDVTQDEKRVRARFGDGNSTEADLLIGADGIRSTVRAQFLPAAKPLYAGYVAWRGLAAERDLSAAAHQTLFGHMAFCATPQSHILGYAVAGPQHSTAPGSRCYNFVWYRPAAAATELKRLCTDAEGTVHLPSIPPPLIRPQILDEMRAQAAAELCPQFAEAIHNSREPFFQPIFDVDSARMVFGRVALLGDAAFVARPHCGAGVAKAAADAAALADALQRHDGHVERALADYESERISFGRWLVEEGRELGNYLQALSEPEARRPSADRHHTPLALIEEIAVPMGGL
jgi:2-polyprenyl-6-methoxyphenol hydroxylase-like FAD-dependent oxidoreductase